MLPKKEIQDIQLQISNSLLGKEQYEFICLRLIDTIRQLEEQNDHYVTELTNLINDDRVPLLIGYWISEILEGNKHKNK